ncbi:MAG: 1-deoxy-D-xylulose-5-phosphate reductoisomerase [Planctomycetaceae bacterium]
MKRIAVLGSTGSIGTSCLDVIRHQGDWPSLSRLTAFGLTACRNWKPLAEQAAEFRPRRVAIAEPDLQGEIPRDAFDGVEVLFGPEGVEAIAADPEVDVVIAGIVGAAGLRGTWAALEAGKMIGLANKETMVVAGPLVEDVAVRTGATIIPVDSEHSAIYQALQCGGLHEVKRVVLTASGGPFRGKKRSELADVTPEMALAHPTWDMGRKITIDSATMTNKALEIIEAKWLFGLRDDQIGVVVHPQSVVHSFVEFVDGSVIAQLSPPDMRLPIQYALTWPNRIDGVAPRLDWSAAWSLTFEPPDEDAFPALALGRECAAKGGSCGAVFNAANEIAVERFLAGEIGFLDISGTARAVLDSHDYDPAPSLPELIRLDDWARREARRWRA